MSIKKIVTTAFFSIVLSLAQANPTPWIWATEATYPPFESTTPSGKIIGFDADLMQAICHHLKHPCQLMNAPFASLIPSLNVGKYDAIIGGLAITPEREKVINFSTSYYQDAVIFVFPSSATNTVISNQSIGVQIGTSYQAFLQQFYPHAHIKTYTSNMDGLMDLAAGRIDAVLIDQPVFIAWLNNHPESQAFTTVNAANTPLQKQALTQLGNGIGIAKGNNILLTKINHALTDLQHNGTLTALQHQWFHHD